MNNDVCFEDSGKPAWLGFFYTAHAIIIYLGSGIPNFY